MKNIIVYITFVYIYIMNFQLKKINKDFWLNSTYYRGWYVCFYSDYQRCCGCPPNTLLSNRTFYKL